MWRWHRQKRQLRKGGEASKRHLSGGVRAAFCRGSQVQARWPRKRGQVRELGVSKTAGTTNQDSHWSQKSRVRQLEVPKQRNKLSSEEEPVRTQDHQEEGAERKSESDRRGGQRPKRKRGAERHPIRHARHPQTGRLSAVALWTLQCKRPREAEETQRADCGGQKGLGAQQDTQSSCLP